MGHNWEFLMLMGAYAIFACVDCTITMRVPLIPDVSCTYYDRDLDLLDSKICPECRNM